MTKLWCLVCKGEFETKRRKVAYFCSATCRKAASRRYAKMRTALAVPGGPFSAEQATRAEIVAPERNAEAAEKCGMV